MSLFKRLSDDGEEVIPDSLVEVAEYGPRLPQYIMLEFAGVLTPVTIENARLLKAEYGGLYFTPNKVRSPEVQELIDKLLKYKL